MLNRQMLFVSLLVFLVAGCGKKNEASNTQETQVEAPNPPAQVVEQSQSEATVETTEDTEMVKKRRAIEFALKEDEIKNDPKGQWAVEARASSSYATDLSQTDAGYHPMQAAGVPNVDRYSDHSNAWTTKEADSGIEWLELDYAKPVQPTEIRIRQTYSPGAIIKVELFDESGTAHTVWQGADMTTYPANEISWLNVKVEKAEYKTQKVKITLATNSVNGWNEIDAVQLVGE